jgi:rhamnose transport system ATP-binding protein
MPHRVLGIQEQRVSSVLLKADSIQKSFAGVTALKRASFELQEGEVHALVGENGAGKSTLIKIMTGAERADSGTLTVLGRRVEHNDPGTARSLGIAAIYQQPSLFPHLTVAENIALALETRHVWKRVDWRARGLLAQDLMARTGAAIDVERLVATLTMPEQQIVEIAKEIGANARILIMDEPTASLSDQEVTHLFDTIARLRSEGVGIIYISHRLDEIEVIADRVTVLSDGETIATRNSRDVNKSELIHLMAGREIDWMFPKRSVSIGEVAFEVRNLSNQRRGIKGVSFSVRKGEIFGLAGLVGSGRTEFAETVLGLSPADSGEILLNRKPVRITSPAQAIAFGIGYVPEDRTRHGVLLDMSVAANVSLADLTAISHRGLLNEAQERELGLRYLTRLRIKAPSVYVDARYLSGGNQQKVALARWLAINPSVLILDEPTHGIDVASKSEIHGLIVELAERGLAIIMISSELPEVLGMSDRIGVMRGGELAGVLLRQEATQEKILALAFERMPRN